MSTLTKLVLFGWMATTLVAYSQYQMDYPESARLALSQFVDPDATNRLTAMTSIWQHTELHNALFFALCFFICLLKDARFHLRKLDLVRAEPKQKPGAFAK